MRDSKTIFLNFIRILLVAALIVFIIVLHVGDKDSKTDIQDMAAAITGVLDMSSMEEASNLTFKRNYDLNASDYEGVIYYAPVSAMDAEEVLIIKLADSSQSEDVVSAISSWIDARATTFEGYAPEQYAQVCDNLLISKGNYVVMVIHPDKDKAKEAFNKAY